MTTHENDLTLADVARMALAALNRTDGHADKMARIDGELHELKARYEDDRRHAKAVRNGPKSYDKRIAALEQAAEVRAEHTARRIETIGDNLAQFADNTSASLANHELRFKVNASRIEEIAEKTAQRFEQQHSEIQRAHKLIAELENRIGLIECADFGAQVSNEVNARQALQDRVEALEDRSALPPGEYTFKVAGVELSGTVESADDECSCETVDECDGSCTAAERAMWNRIYGDPVERQATDDTESIEDASLPPLASFLRAEYGRCLSAGMTRVEAVNCVGLRARQIEVEVMTAAVEIAEENL